MNAAVKSPCIACDRLLQDKSDITCTNCEARQEYLKTLGGPWEPVPALRVVPPPTFSASPPKEDQPMPAAENKIKLCPECKQEKSFDEFSKNRQRVDGKDRTCKACKNAQQKIFRENQKRKREAGQGSPVSPVIKESPVEPEAPKAPAPAVDPKSRYYDAGGIETISIIKAKLTPDQYVGYLLGNTLKYAARLSSKGDTARDAEKLARYSGWLAEACGAED
jgi:hypothetical protein